MNQFKFKLSVIIMMLLCPLIIYAQRGYSTASLHWGKMNAEQKRDAMKSGANYFEYGIPNPEDVIIEEYFNYHTHEIAMPGKDKSVALDLQWGNPTINEHNNSAIFQLGIATSDLNKGSIEDAPPVNVSLVIDKSGSMSSDSRLVNAKEAATAFISRLRPTDHISIVAFDNNVEVVLASTQVGDKKKVLAAIDKIQLGGSTNLNAGLIAGYNEVAKAYVSGRPNKVIMLTDALTNTGVVSPQKIVQNSTVFNKEYHIDISMIGVGVDFNHELSRHITDNANSSIHFINDSKDIKKVFVDEVESLLFPVARDVKLVLEFGEEVTIGKFFGYNPTIEENRIELDLKNLNKGLTQLFIGRIKVTDPSAKTYRMKATLEYFNIASNEQQSVTIMSNLKYENSKGIYDPLENAEVRKNYAIASMGQAMHDMALYVKNGQKTNAMMTVNKTVDFVHTLFDGKFDPDVKRVLDIIKTYQADIELALETNKNRSR
ncbi:MAG: VWA domain-containing protein [Crocinitomicaceae bacterium]